MQRDAVWAGQAAGARRVDVLWCAVGWDGREADAEPRNPHSPGQSHRGAVLCFFVAWRGGRGRQGGRSAGRGAQVEARRGEGSDVGVRVWVCGCVVEWLSE